MNDSLELTLVPWLGIHPFQILFIALLAIAAGLGMFYGVLLILDGELFEGILLTAIFLAAGAGLTSILWASALDEANSHQAYKDIEESYSLVFAENTSSNRPNIGSLKDGKFVTIESGFLTNTKQSVTNIQIFRHDDSIQIRGIIADDSEMVTLTY